MVLIPAAAEAQLVGVQKFLEKHCYECHGDGMDKGGLDFDELGVDLSDPAIFAKWEDVHDRVVSGEMPPKKVKTRPGDEEIAQITGVLSPALTAAHAEEKGTVLRRLNRKEYQNTMNDLFGTNLDLAGMLPEDGRSHEFDNVGEALGISMAHLERYLEAARLVYDTAITDRTEAPESKVIDAKFRDSEVRDRAGKIWKFLPNGHIIRFQGGGYPSGLLRESGVQTAGFYKVKVTGYAYQSEEPVICSIGGESYQRGSAKPTYTYAAFPPNEPTTIEFTQWIEANYMLVIEPQKIALPQPRPESVEDYQGPGFAFVSATIEGPIYDEYPLRGHKLVYQGIERREIEPELPAYRTKRWYKPEFEIISDDPRADALQSIKRVAQWAWRRSVDVADVATYIGLFDAEIADGAEFEPALRTAVTALFVSPNFLYLREPAGKLDDFAIANRLALFLTRGAPDAELFALATNGKLGNPDAIRAQTERLMWSPDFARFLTDYTESWLNLRELDFTVPDQALFPEFDAYLRHSMPMETEAFLNELIESNLPVSNVVKSDFAMLNSRLAEHYGLPPVAGPEIQKVSLPADSLRGGFLSQGSVLKVSANGTNTSPVLRGVWVMERIIGEAPNPPPPGIPGVEPDIRGAETLRQLLDQHRDSTSCQACHEKIDPPGFALECFNPIGGFRDRFRSMGGSGERVDILVRGRKVRYQLGQNVDASGVLPDGREFTDFIEFRDHLAADEAQLAKAFVTKLLTFATGREMGFSDRPEITRIVESAAADGYRVRRLVHAVTQSEIFLTK